LDETLIGRFFQRQYSNLFSVGFFGEFPAEEFMKK
jgi:hypothetical protein